MEAFNVTTMIPTIVPIYKSFDQILVVVAVVIVPKVAHHVHCSTKMLVVTAVFSKCIVVGTIFAAVSPAVIVVAVPIVLIAAFPLRCCCGDC